MPVTKLTDSLAASHLTIGIDAPAELRSYCDVWLDERPDDPALIARVEQLWHERLVPFADNWRAGRRAPRRQQAVLFDHDYTWAAQARRLIGRLQTVVGRSVLRIDHIGSTSVPGLAAKDLVDIQVVVPDLGAAAAVAERGRAAGFVHVPGDWFGTDRHGRDHPEHVLVDADPGRPVNINIRPVTAPIWLETLLFRDWLRTHPDGRAEYEAVKRQLAARPGGNVDDYSIDKMPFVSEALGRAERWAADVGWQP